MNLDQARRRLQGTPTKYHVPSPPHSPFEPSGDRDSDSKFVEFREFLRQAAAEQGRLQQTTPYDANIEPEPDEEETQIVAENEKRWEAKRLEVRAMRAAEERASMGATEGSHRGLSDDVAGNARG